MRRILSLVVLAFLIPLVHAQDKPAPVRVCVAMLENTSRHIVNPTWERDQLVRALERTNKSKEVKKGKAPKIETVSLESSDRTVKEKNCEYVLYTDLTEVLQAGRPEVSLPSPGAVQVGSGMGDPRGYPPEYHSATVNYRLMRAGNFRPWAEGMVNADDALAEDVLVSQLMGQVANRVVDQIRKPHAGGPE